MRIDRDGTIIRDNGERPDEDQSDWRSSNHGHGNDTDIGDVIFYIVTILLSVVVSFLTASFANAHFSEDFWGGLVCFLMFLVGVAGCFCYNIIFSCLHDFWEGFLSVLSAFGAAMIIGVILFLLLPLIKFVLTIAAVIIVICVVFSFSS